MAWNASLVDEPDGAKWLTVVNFSRQNRRKSLIEFSQFSYELMSESCSYFQMTGACDQL